MSNALRRGRISFYVHIYHVDTYIYNAIHVYITRHSDGNTDRCVSVCCVLVADKVQTLVDFNEVPAEEKLPLVCQITPGVPCMPLLPSSLHHTYDFILPRNLITHTVAFLLANHMYDVNNIVKRRKETVAGYANLFMSYSIFFLFFYHINISTNSNIYQYTMSVDNFFYFIILSC